jgi:hypothetical protein
MALHHLEWRRAEPGRQPERARRNDMKLTDFIHSELGRLHGLFEKGVADLTPEEWHALPCDGTNSIAFVVWHYARTEDNVVRFLLQNRRPTVWMEGGYAEKLGLPPVAQGTGMDLADAQALRIGDIDLFRRYMEETWKSTDEFFAHPDEAALEMVITVRPLGEMPAIRALGQVCATHGYGHAGHVDLLRAELGKPGLGI